jgi:MFS family permease
MLLLVRVFRGIVSATSGPAIPSLVGDLVPARERARTFGYITSGQIIGVAVGFLLPVIVLGFASWRWNFWVLAIAGAILAVLLWRLPEPARTGAAGPQHSEEEGNGTEGADSTQTRVEEIVRRQRIRPSQRAMVREPPVEMSLWEAGKYVLRVRTDVIVLVARSVGDFFFQAVATFAVVFATSWYSLTNRQADVVFLAIGLGALAGVLVLGRLGDHLLRREWLNSRIWISALAYLLAPFALFPAFSTHSLWIALPLYAVGAFLLIGAGPPLDAVRVDVIVPRLRGRAESIRQVLRTLAEGGAPVIIGFLSERLLGGGDRGLWAALVITLPLLFANGLILLLCLRTYPRDIAAALASSRRWDTGDPDSDHHRDAHAS